MSDLDNQAIASDYGTEMMADQAALAADAGWQARCSLAGAAVALAVQAEPEDTENHPRRWSFSRQVLLSPATYAYPLALAAVADGLTTASAGDGAIRLRLAVVWDRLAGFGP